MPYRIIAAIVLSLVAIAAMPRPCAACTCSTFNPAEAYNWADHVFHGRVMEVETLRRNPNMPMRARLQIETVWKGELVSEVFAEGGTGADCRVPWQEGEAYIVFAQASDSGALRTYSCQGTGTGLVSHAPYPVAAYGAGTPVPDTAPAHDNVINRTSQPSGADDWPLSLVAISIAVAGGFLAHVLIARRRLR